MSPNRSRRAAAIICTLGAIAAGQAAGAAEEGTPVDRQGAARAAAIMALDDHLAAQAARRDAMRRASMLMTDAAALMQEADRLAVQCRAIGPALPPAVVAEFCPRSAETGKQSTDGPPTALPAAAPPAEPYVGWIAWSPTDPKVQLSVGAETAWLGPSGRLAGWVVETIEPTAALVRRADGRRRRLSVLDGR